MSFGVVLAVACLLIFGLNYLFLELRYVKFCFSCNPTHRLCVFLFPVDRDQEDKEQFFVGLPFEKLGF